MFVAIMRSGTWTAQVPGSTEFRNGLLVGTTAVEAINVVWFRDDLRTADHPALDAAMADRRPGRRTVAVYVLDEVSPGIRPLGAAAKWWLHHGLAELHQQLERLNVPLLLRRGPASSVVPDLARELCDSLALPPASLSVFWNRRYGFGERAVDAEAKNRIRQQGGAATSSAGTLLHEPWTVQTQDGRPYKVFTPFYNALQQMPLRPSLPAPAAQCPLPDMDVPGDDLGDWQLLPTAPDWTGGLAATWEPGEEAAHSRLNWVLSEVAAGYPSGRDLPGRDGTSRLSPALRWGHLSPVQVWEALGSLAAGDADSAEGARAMMRQLAWRDFCWNLLYHHPQMDSRNIRAEFDGFDWAWPAVALPGLNPEGAGGPGQELVDVHFTAWCRGETGFALVDAGMKQLWETGWMHNRVRMVVASLLVKNLGIHWRAGEAWFWDTLVDADAASNPANWQWMAGCGADAAPYFRVFNPLLQAKKFDPQGRYIAQHAPALSPEPIVDLPESRRAALAAYEHMKAGTR